MIKRGLLIVFSGPSGVGKDTVLDLYLQGREGIMRSVSATTRAPRENEINGVDYHFVTREQFLHMVEHNEMFEYAEYQDNFYGTPRTFLEAELDAGRDVVLKIEVQGAMQVKNALPEAVLVFVLPPSLAELRRRLEKRGTEDKETVNGRMLAAMAELEQAPVYDYVIVNDDINRAVKQFDAIIQGAKHSTKYQKKLIEEVLNNA